MDWEQREGWEWGDRRERNVCVYEVMFGVCDCGMMWNRVIVRTDQMSRETYGACSQMAKENEVSKNKKRAMG